MLGIVQFPLFVLAVVALNATPGPDIAYVAGQSMVHGRRAGILSASGVALGGCLHTICCAIGLTALLATSPSAFTAIKWLGGLYLIYLGVRTLFSKVSTDELRPEIPLLSNRKLLFRGFLTNASNPKVLLFYVAFFPQFVTPDSADKTAAFLVLGAVFVVLGFINDVAVAWLAAKAMGAVSGRPQIRKWIDRVIGTTFIGMGVRLALTHK
ncbi:RhtB (resistance to homoserine/threonine) family protein [Pseudomonas sp. JUb42]|uniref:LysE family translocator n=1 Tax=Pseudomonas sp. JUb42 TaxID=2940611 RepID=UPI002169848D|nr:LysE family translocator [Pseudomonas sp. JUb42]MCS3469322.1 RhtB (resistance to homoserine/threonine) family protein [Pseudomonas sp. JUb42]